MRTFTYNDLVFSVEKSKHGWDITYTKQDGTKALAGTGLFDGLAESEVEAKATVLVKSIFPVGLKLVGPDTAHPSMVGDLKIVGPDVTHPNFIHWDKKSSSFPERIG